MAYVVREVTDARAMDAKGFASFETMDAAMTHVQESFDILFGEEDDGAYDAIVRPKGKKFMMPFQISITAR